MNEGMMKEFHGYIEFLKTKGYKEYKLNKLREYFIEYLSKKQN